MRVTIEVGIKNYRFRIIYNIVSTNDGLNEFFLDFMTTRAPRLLRVPK